MRQIGLRDPAETGGGGAGALVKVVRKTDRTSTAIK